MADCILVDLDKTLAEYDGWHGPEHIGKPIPEMWKKVKKAMKAGFTVKIFTARASVPSNIPHIEKWLKRHRLPNLEITCQKDFETMEIWDDRCRQVEPNTGMFVDELKEPVPSTIMGPGTITPPIRSD